MRFLYLMTLVFSLAVSSFAAPASSPSSKAEGVFTSVNGTVLLFAKNGSKSTPVKNGVVVVEGDRVKVDKGSDANLRFFDGSDLKINANTDFRVTKLQKPSLQDKAIRIKLSFGRILAKVKKLTSSKSSFETEAGGVVCGVRGTEYSMTYNPETGKVDIVVLDGTVWANGGGQNFTYGPGDKGHFTNGQPDGNNNGNQNGGNGQGQGNGGQGNGGGNDFNPFYGLHGAQQDYFNPLLDLGGSTGDAAGQTGDTILQGLGAHTLILQFGLPENI